MAHQPSHWTSMSFYEFEAALASRFEIWDERMPFQVSDLYDLAATPQQMAQWLIRMKRGGKVAYQGPGRGWEWIPERNWAP